ncbi:MAG: sugar phosphate isomerase/epimerase [Myxococcota bacterium]
MDDACAKTRRAFVLESAAWLATGWAAGAARAIDALGPASEAVDRSRSFALSFAGLASSGGLAPPPELGLQSFTLRRYALEPMLDRLVDLGVRRVELIPELEILFYRLGSHFPVTTDRAEIARVVDAVRARGLALSASGVHAVGDAEEAKRLFDFAARAEIPLLTIAPDEEALDPLDRLCAEHPQIRLGIHNHGPWTRHASIADVERSLAGRAPNFGACADLGHFIRAGEDPVAALRRLGPRVFGVHLKDHREAGFFAAGCPLGDGRLDLEACFRALREIGFGPDRALSLELEWGDQDQLADVRLCLERARSAIASVAAEASPVGGPGRVGPARIGVPGATIPTERRG